MIDSMDFKASHLRVLQYNVGYSKGVMNLIALLGLMGEVGEVIEEWLKVYHSHARGESYILKRMEEVVPLLKNIDTLKKQVRNKNVDILLPDVDPFSTFNEEALDKEIADVLYYLSAIAVGRGKTLEYYLQLTVDKVEDIHKSKDIRMADVSHAWCEPAKRASNKGK